MKKFLKKIIINIVPSYKSIIGKQNKKVICSYINDSFLFEKTNSNILLKHGNKREALVIRDVFNELGFNFYSIRYDKSMRINKYKKWSNPQIVFGIEPNFEKLSEKYNKSIKIYYATGAYKEHQNKMIKIRTDYVNEYKLSKIPYYRMVSENNAAFKADYIIQIGSKYTIETYPKELRDKIYTIRQSSFEFLNLNINDKKKAYKKNNYMWFGSNGSILKGLDILLEYFKNDPMVNLHIVGPIDDEFIDVFKEELFCTNNINYYGYIPIYDSKLIEIANKCSFIIYPSASEGGVPGSVLNMMKLGLIPILSKYASFDEIDQLGIKIDELNQKQINKAIRKSKKLNEKELEIKFIECSKYVNDNHTLKTFKEDFKRALLKILSNERRI
ncbi:glycosyltransferase [Clostridium perfringens]|nr:glycosyltransferase [Clostridium perfringens]